MSFGVWGMDAVPKERPRTVFRGGKAVTFTPERTKAWEQVVAQYARMHWKGEPDGDGYWEVCLSFYRKSNRKADLDNLSKAVLDALNGIVWEDDKQVYKLTLAKLRAPTTAQAGVHIQAWRYEDEQDELHHDQDD